MCSQPLLCANQLVNIDTPPNGFKIECTAADSCSGSRINLVWPDVMNPSPAESYVDLIKVTVEGAVMDSVITIDNRKASKVYINTIECGAGYCAGATFMTKGDVQYMDFKCDEITGCGAGCVLVDKGSSPYACNEKMTL